MELSCGELTVLTEDELEKIHQSSLEILCTTGINIGHEKVVPGRALKSSTWLLQ
ncbi:MAG: hypothetical protein V5A83_02765 [Candidatus Bipolaricaulota bacterium]